MLSKLLINEILSNGEYYTALSAADNNQYHCHEFIEIVYVVAGNAIHELNEKKQTVTVGDAFILKPTDFHRFIPSENSSSFLHRDICVKTDEFKKICDFIYLSADNDFLNANIHHQCKLSTDTVVFFENYFKSFSLDINSNCLNRICKTVISMLLIEISNNNPQTSSAPIPDWIRQIVDYAKSPYFYQYPISRLTENIPFSKQHICNMFKKHIGMSITEYFLQQRLNYAKHLILQTSDSISNIAYTTGFNNESFFYRSFKKRFGITPLELRKKVN
ncbi:MAG: helix-turn-helix transcriptional regulator [Clostridia bacterium]|nr:helix-turn-helix transcriptional regulator [Clostridia bacterium]